MAAPLFNFGGIASGLDTDAMIKALMDVDRNPIRLMERKQATAQVKVDAWSEMTTRVSALRTSVDDLKSLDKFEGLVSVASTDETAVEASGTGSALAGNTSFTVTQLAVSHQMVTQADYSSESDTVGAGTFTLNVGGVDTDFATSAGTTVANLAAQINDSGIGVSASVIKVDDTTSKLVIAASSTGANNVFTASGTQSSLTTLDISSQGADAQLTIGDGPGAFAITRGSNTITDLIDGVEIKLKTTTATPITIGVEKDLDQTIESIQNFVTELTAMTGAIKNRSQYDAENNRAASLTGDSTLRGISSGLVSGVMGLVDSLVGDYSYASSVGIEYSSKGEFTLDTEKLRSALEDDYDAVARFFARSGQSGDSRMSYSYSNNSTQPGAYDVVVTQAATQASTVGSLYVAPGSDLTMTINVGGTDVLATIGSGDNLQAAVTKINAALDTAGFISLRATETGGAIKLGQLKYGSSGDFTVTNSGALGLDGVNTAQDVIGTIDGNATTGTGQTLLANTGDSDGLGITIQLTTGEITAGGGSVNLGAMTYSKGLMGQLSETIDLWEGTEGLLARAQDRWELEIDTYDERIAEFERRLEQREATLRRTFTAMETSLSTLQGQSSYMASVLGIGTAPES